MLKRHWLTACLGCIVAMVIAAIAGYRPLILWWMHTRPFSAEAFDAARWRVGLKASEEGECVRGRMANDIIAKIARPQASRRPT
jgi:hypothetical protein